MTPEEPSVTPAPGGEAEPFPFWGYADLLFAAGLALPCMFAGWAIVRLVIWALHLHGVALAAQAVPEMLIGYALLFGFVAVIFRLQYSRPFWSSLGWTPSRIPLAWCVLSGFGATLLVGAVGRLLRTPPPTGPLIELLKDRSTLLLVAIFGTTVAPLCEELAFRGFLQPLLVRSTGTAAGIAIASAIFGALHYSEYGNSWRSASMVAVSGVCFGCLRHFSGSTRASTIAHAAFNALPFVLLLTQGKNASL